MIKILELFAGIGACTTALEHLKIEHQIVDAVEVDRWALRSFNAIHGTNFETQDIRLWDKDIECDLIMHGSPCQDFSIAGKQAGGDKNSGTRSSLMYETLRIIEKLKPKYVIWENVKNLLSKKHRHNFDNYLDKMQELGYKNYYQVLDAKDFGIPQHRERVFTISIRNDIEKEFAFPDKQELKLRLKDMLEQQVEEKFYLSNKQIEQIEHWNSYRNPIKEAKNVDADTSYCITAKSNTGLNASMLLLKENENSFVSERYKNFIEKNGYIPEMFNAYNEVEIKDISPTQTAKCGSFGTSATVLIKESEPEVVITSGAYARNFGSKGKLQNDNVCDTILSSMGTGGGNVPIIKTIGNYSPSGYEASRIVDSNGIAPTVKENHGTVTATNENLRIRKLTPKECWRLMGFTDAEFEKAQPHCSNTQLYKQAGNSIVVNVLEKILTNLLEEDKG